MFFNGHISLYVNAIIDKLPKKKTPVNGKMFPEKNNRNNNFKKT